ncbi:MAG: glycosyltransferase [Thermoleophilaceae bacterium]
MAAEAIDISVVIPTRDRIDALARTLDALAAQEVGGVAAEAVVVDNRSSGAARALSRRWEGPFPLEVVAEETPGAAAARNAGIARARGRRVLFLGDDCRPVSSGFVAGHARAPDGVAVLGRTEWDPEIEPTPVMRWLERSGHMVDFDRVERCADSLGPWAFYTGNLSVARQALLDVAGFDQRFSGYGWEDNDLGLRLFDRGLRMEYRPGLLALHAHRYDTAASLSRMEAVGRGARLLHRLHDHRRPLPGPPAGRARLLAGRLLAPAPAGWFRASHLAAFARGYLGDPLPVDAALRGYGALPSDPRPAVSVVVPFAGSAEEASVTAEALRGLSLRDGDELILVDNSGAGVVSPQPFAVVDAAEEGSSYYARNVGAEAARNDWLLFLDADTRPPATLLDDYFRERIDDRCGAVAGGVVAARGQRAFVARYAASRGYLSQAAHFRDAHRPYGITANLLVRREAWAGVGGFLEGIRSGGDQALCWRIQDAGWTLELREAAAVEHLHRERLVPLLRQMARYSAAIAWMGRKVPGSSPRPKVVGRLARAGTGAVGWTFALQPRRAAYKLLDGAVVLAEAAGYLASNRAPAAVRDADVAYVLDSFPELSETFVTTELRAFARLGVGLRVEAAGRAWRRQRGGGRGLNVAYGEDDGMARKVADLAWLASRHPLRCVRDLRARARWRRDEPVRPLRALAPAARRVARAGARHLHAHFAGGAALDAMRIAALLDLPYSVTAHAYDIWQRPANLREKLEGAAFAATVSDYGVDELARLAPAARLHKIAMGVDASFFSRRTPHPGGRTVLAVGRLVEKKGFRHLIEAARIADVERVVITGAGRLEPELRALAEGAPVELVGPRDADGVRSLMEEADIFVAPSVIAADGDRDSIPVVVREALAMELPVVASEVAGLPEVVRPEWGRLVPPADPAALAAALDSLLALPVDVRVEMGRLGRRFVMETADPDREAARLAALIDKGGTVVDPGRYAHPIDHGGSDNGGSVPEGAARDRG